MEELTKPTLTIEPSSETFQTFANRPYISDKLREQLSRANVLIIPNEGYGELTELVYFPSGTTELFHFLGEKKIENLTVDICIEEEDYKEVALHADWLTLANFVVTGFVAPLLAGLIAEFIMQRLGKREAQTNVKSKMIIFDERKGRYVNYSYEGPASEYHAVMLNAITEGLSAPVLPEKRKRKRGRHLKNER